MPTWRELDRDFEALAEALRHYHIQYQWGAAGTIYRLSGGGSHATARFQALAAIAGRKIQELPVGVVDDEVLKQPELDERWYEALRYHSGAFDFGHVGFQSDEAGNDLGAIYTGSLNQPARYSAVVALQFSQYDPPAQQVGGIINVGQQGGVLSVGQHGDVHARQHIRAPESAPPRPPWWKSTAAVIAGIVSFIAAVAVILTWMGLEPHRSHGEPTPKQTPPVAPAAKP